MADNIHRLPIRRAFQAFAVALAVLLLLTQAACSSTASQPADAEPEASAEATAAMDSEPEPEAEPEAEAEVDESQADAAAEPEAPADDPEAPPTDTAEAPLLPTDDGPALEDPTDTGERVVLVTNHGEMRLRLFPDEAPRTVAQFKRLVEEGFYDGLPFYRVVDGHVIQAGDGGENDKPTVPLEAEGHPHVEGAVGLARDTDPDSGATEFYICLAPRPHLDGNYAVFGQLTDGYGVLREIGAVEVDEQWVGENQQVAFHSPKEEVVIKRAYVLAPGAADADDDE